MMPNLSPPLTNNLDWERWSIRDSKSRSYTANQRLRRFYQRDDLTPDDFDMRKTSRWLIYVSAPACPPKMRREIVRRATRSQKFSRLWLRFVEAFDYAVQSTDYRCAEDVDLLIALIHTFTSSQWQYRLPTRNLYRYSGSRTGRNWVPLRILLATKAPSHLVRDWIDDVNQTSNRVTIEEWAMIHAVYPELVPDTLDMYDVLMVG